jgi:2-oxoisovalerate dehydrogenase E1 component
MRDLHEEGDKGWMDVYPAPDRRIALGEVGQHGDGTDLAIVTYGNGCYLSRKAAKGLEDAGIGVRVIDMRWLAPQPDAALLEATQACRSVLIVDECRQTGSQSEALMALFAEAGRRRVARVTAKDCFIATGPAYAATLPSVDEITSAAKALFGADA